VILTEKEIQISGSEAL